MEEKRKKSIPFLLFIPLWVQDVYNKSKSSHESHEWFVLDMSMSWLLLIVDSSSKWRVRGGDLKASNTYHPTRRPPHTSAMTILTHAINFKLTTNEKLTSRNTRQDQLFTMKWTLTLRGPAVNIWLLANRVCQMYHGCYHQVYFLTESTSFSDILYLVKTVSKQDRWISSRLTTNSSAKSSVGFFVQRRKKIKNNRGKIE